MAGRPLEPETVVREELGIEKRGDGGESDMGMRRDVHRLSGGEVDGAGGIQEAPGSDRPSLTPGKDPSDRETAEVGQASGEDLEGRLGGRFADAQFEFGRRRKIAHRGTSMDMMLHPPASPGGLGAGMSH